MKWFKHMVDAHKDPTLRVIFKKYGLEGEARFWRLVSIIAEKYENETEHIVLDLETIRESLRFRSATDCRPFLDLLATQTQMIFNYSGNIVQIKWDKILEIKDNHTRNLQATRKRVSKNLHLDRDIDIDKEVEVEVVTKNNDHEKETEEVWNQIQYSFGYPRELFDEVAKDAYLIFLTTDPSSRNWKRFLSHYFKNEKQQIRNRLLELSQSKQQEEFSLEAWKNDLFESGERDV